MSAHETLSYPSTSTTNLVRLFPERSYILSFLEAFVYIQAFTFLATSQWSSLPLLAAPAVSVAPW